MDVDPMSEFVPIMGMPTHVMRYGTLHRDHGHQQIMYLVIPGNPGIIEYYQAFMAALFKSSNYLIPVWGMSHAGHVTIPKSAANLDIVRTSYDVCSLAGQIQHKLTYINEYIPEDVKLILIGHSIGCYMILKLLKCLKRRHVLRCFLLFPTIERMAETPKGQIATPLLRYMRWVGYLIVYAFSYLSPHLQYRVILYFFRNRGVPKCAYNASMNLFDPFCVQNLMYMASQEMNQVSELDVDDIKENIGKLSFYYGRDDHWCPRLYFDEMKCMFPHADIKLCAHSYDHAFVLDSSQEMADIVWNWSQKDFKKSSD